MRRVRYYEYGDPEVLKAEEADVPEPGPGQVLIRAEAIGANFVDTKMRRTPSSDSIFHRPLPGKLTGDVVGTVERVGPGVDPGLTGRRVAALVAEDAFADFSVADAAWLAPAPEGLEPGAASALPMAGPMALGILRAGRLEPGETVLVHSGGSGIGHLAVQLAKRLGAGTVIATASSPEKRALALAHGADTAVDYGADDWPDRVREAAPNGVDIVLDAVGGRILRQSLDLLPPFGRAVVYGMASGEAVDIPSSLFFGARSVTGFSLYAVRQGRPDQARREMAEVAGYLAAGQLHTPVHARIPLADAAEAHRLIEERSPLGRVLLVP